MEIKLVTLNYLGKNGFRERELRIFAGWSSDSKMSDIYLHYDEEEVEKKLRKMKGFVEEEDEIKQIIESKTLEPKSCPRCQQKNPATAKYCNCGMALDLKTIMKDTKKRETADEKLNDLFADDEFKEMVKDYLKKKNSS